MKIILSYLIASILTFSSVTAEGLDGNAWMEYKGKESRMDSFLEGIVQGYLLGKRSNGHHIKEMIEEGKLLLDKHPERGFGYHLYMVDALSLQCDKKGTTLNQLIAIIDKYIRNNPKKWHISLETLFHIALVDSGLFTCNPKNYRDNEIQKYIRHSF